MQLTGSTGDGWVAGDGRGSVAIGGFQAEGEAAKTWGEKEFRWHHNEDAMATEKTAEGIRAFAVDGKKLDDLVAKAIG